MLDRIIEEVGSPYGQPPMGRPPMMGPHEGRPPMMGPHGEQPYGGPHGVPPQFRPNERPPMMGPLEGRPPRPFEGQPPMMEQQGDHHRRHLGAFDNFYGAQGPHGPHVEEDWGFGGKRRLHEIEDESEEGPHGGPHGEHGPHHAIHHAVGPVILLIVVTYHMFLLRGLRDVCETHEKLNGIVKKKGGKGRCHPHGHHMRHFDGPVPCSEQEE